MLEIKSLTFSYGDKIIYNDASLSLVNNGIYYLDAPNGSGKSTLFKILKNKLPFKGSILVDGNSNSSKLITHIDYNLVIEHRLNVYDQIALYVNDESKINEYLTSFKLYEVRNSKIKQLSDGEKSRLVFLLGILENNPIILIDEIYSHLDSESMEIVSNVVNKLSESKIIICTSHKDFFKLNYNYRITIKNNKLDVETVNKEILKSNSNLEISNPIINKKILKKFIEFKPRYIFIFLLIIFSIFTTLFYNVFSLNRFDIERSFINRSNNIAYVVNDVNSYMIDGHSYVDYHDEYGKNIVYCGDEQTIFDLGDLKIEDDEFYAKAYKEIKSFPFFIDTVYILDKYKNTTLNDDEMIISDYLYRNLEETCLKYGEEVIFTKSDEKYLAFRDKNIKIKGIINNKYNQLIEPYYVAEPNEYQEYLNNRIYDNKEFINNYNYFYHNVIMNQNTFDSLINDGLNYYKNFSLYHKNYPYEYQKQVIKNKTNGSLIEGRMPNNKNEIVINIEFKNNPQLLNSIIYLTDKEVNTLNANKFATKSLNLDEYTVVGYSDVDDIIFYNDEAILDYYKTIYDSFKTNALINPSNEIIKNIYKEDHNKIIYQNLNDTKLIVKHLDDGHVLFATLFYLSLSLLIILLVTYIVFERKYYAKDMKILKNKCIDSQLIKNDKIVFIIKNIVFGVLLFIVLILISNYFDLFNKLVNEMLGLSGYKII